MPKIENWIIEKVKDAADIVDVVGEILGTYDRNNPGGLKKAGVNYTAICPFHEDHNSGNFIVRPKGLRNGGNTYHCFVCMRQGEGGGPVDFLMKHEHLSFSDAIRWLGKKYNIMVDNVPVNYTPPPPRPVPPPPPTLEIPRDIVRKTMQRLQGNVFINWLTSLQWSDAQRRRLGETLWQYCVGCWPDGRVVFWGIDHDGHPRAAKLMRYDPDGHRNKKEHPGWLYNQDGYRQQLKPDEHTIMKPMFGSHLLKLYPEATVNVVESEKTALVMANFYGCPESQLWLACGGIKHLQLESMQPLIDQGRTVWLWPDKDGKDEWQELADKLGSDKVNVYTTFFDTCWMPEDGEKADAADIIIRMMAHPEQKPRPVEREVVPPKTPIKTEVYDDVFKNEPFLDQLELLDPVVRRERDILRRAYPGKKHRMTELKSNIDGVNTIGEILQDHPLLNQLIDDQNKEDNDR